MRFNVTLNAYLTNAIEKYSTAEINICFLVFLFIQLLLLFKYIFFFVVKNYPFQSIAESNVEKMVLKEHISFHLATFSYLFFLCLYAWWSAWATFAHSVFEYDNFFPSLLTVHFSCCCQIIYTFFLLLLFCYCIHFYELISDSTSYYLSLPFFTFILRFFTVFNDLIK